jgi:transposase
MDQLLSRMDPTMNKKYIVKLTAADRQTLEALVRRGRVAAHKAKRAWILLQADASPEAPGWSDEQIQAAYGVSLRTVHRVRQTWVEQGLPAVLTRARKSRHRARKLDGEHEAHLIALACSKPPAGRRRWTIRLLAQRFVEMGHCAAVSPETIRQTLKKTNSSRTW